MHTRREFISLAARLAVGAGVTGNLIESIARAQEIAPTAGSSFHDAEHVVILMQENRSFDHLFGTLRGVRGFNDPRAITLPDGNPVWVQTDAAGNRYAPFRFDLAGSKATWMGCLPHDRPDQVDARNNGLCDKWLPAKQSGIREYAAMPLALGYYTREDLPFYYALADAFTVCDQYFCSSLTATTPNRLYHWTGTVRARPAADSPAVLRNENADLNHLVRWPTFPERLQAHGVSWKVYQNSLTVPSGMDEEQTAWLGNFGDNPLEYFTQYHVQFAASHKQFIDDAVQVLRGEVAAIRRKLTVPGEAAETAALNKQLAMLAPVLKRYETARDQLAKNGLDQLTVQQKDLHNRAFCTNAGDPQYEELREIAYRDGDAERRLRVPAGDVLHQFRADVSGGTLPTVSWLVSPQKFSDHPSSAWYGAWYIAAVLDILTRNPDVWKKTIFILNYDENDGYFDHASPFVAPHPRHPETGRVTKGIDTSLEYVELEQDRKWHPAAQARDSSIGLGYRVPMVIASPWSRGGCVCSQVYDHTSVLQFLETFLTRKLGKKIEEPNISEWRRAVCGDLTAAFQASANDVQAGLKFPSRNAFLAAIHRAQYRDLPGGYHALTAEECEQIRRDPKTSRWLPRQEAGVRPSCPLPYELGCEGSLDVTRTRFTIRFEASHKMFGQRAAGSAFSVQALGGTAGVKVRDYAVEAGETLEDSWSLKDFDGNRYHFRAYGPNGFFREFSGGPDDPAAEIRFQYAQAKGSQTGGNALSGGIEILATNRDPKQTFTVDLRDNAYKQPAVSRAIGPGKSTVLALETKPSAGWYDASVRIIGRDQFEKRYAGRVETGTWSTSDPAMG